MERLSLAYPVSPHVVNRGWGYVDPAYVELGFARHNGVDLALSEGQEIRAPFECRVSLVGNQPRGSGNFVCLLSTKKHLFDDGTSAYVELTFMHLKESLVTGGMRIRTGDLVAYGGHTGRASGDHVHVAPKRVRKGLFGYRDLDRNDADGTFDPEPYWSGAYASSSQP